MSQLLEKINAEYARLEQEQKLIDCCPELRQEMLNIKQDLICKITDITIASNLKRLQDMHDFIYSNPTLKGNLPELTWQRFLEIYKTNHVSDLGYRIDHDKNPETEPITVGQLIDEIF